VSIKSTREAFIRALIELAERDESYALVSADSMAAARAIPFKEKFPHRVFDVGIAEQCAVDFAAGLASTGLKPFVVTYCGFITMRACEQMRTFVAYPELPVRFIGFNGGLFGGEREGVTHQFFEDLGIVRTIPGISVATPADANQVYKMTFEIADVDGPVYMRLCSGREHEVYSEDAECKMGKANIVCDYGRDVAVFSNGYILNRAIEAVEALKMDGVNAVLIDVTSLKPLDTDTIVKLISECKCAVTIEDHNIIGGLGSAICETAAEHCPVPVKRIGLADIYPRSGHPEQLLDHYGITSKAVVEATKQLVAQR